MAMVVLFECYQGLSRWIGGQRNAANGLGVILLPILFYTQGSEFSSPGTDFPILLMTFFLAVRWLARLENKLDLSSDDLALATVPVYALTVKVSALYLLIFTAWILWRLYQKRHIGGIFLLIVTGLFIGMPWLARNVVVSGYLLYPQTIIDAFKVDWKIPIDQVKADQRDIIGWARVPRMSPSEAMKFSTQEWTRLWWGDKTINQKILLVMAGLSPVVILLQSRIRLTMKRCHLINSLALLPVTGMAFLGSVFWFLTAPDLRFGLGTVSLLAALLLVAPLGWAGELFYQRKSSFQVFPFLILSFLTLYQAFFLFHSVLGSKDVTRLILPKDYPHAATTPCEFRDKTIICAQEWKACWYHPLPCAVDSQPNVEQRGSNLADGYRYVP